MSSILSPNPEQQYDHAFDPTREAPIPAVSEPSIRPLGQRDALSSAGVGEIRPPAGRGSYAVGVAAVGAALPHDRNPGRSDMGQVAGGTDAPAQMSVEDDTGMVPYAARRTGSGSRQGDTPTQGVNRDAGALSSDSPPSARSGGPPGPPKGPRLPGAEGLPDEPDGERRRQARQEVRVKTYLVRQDIAGAAPASQEDEAIVANARQINANKARLLDPTSEAKRQVSQCLGASSTPDVFSIQERCTALVKEVLADTDQPDMVDLAVAAGAVNDILADVISGLPERTRTANQYRHEQFALACGTELVDAVHSRIILQQSEFADVVATTAKIHNKTPEAFDERELATLAVMQEYAKDKMRLAALVVQGGLSGVVSPEEQSVYAREPQTGEIEVLNRRVGAVLEQLPHVRMYGLSPYEVRARDIELPWDIAVVTPIDPTKPQSENEYSQAEGALADIWLLAPDDARQRTSIKLQYSQERGYAGVRLGDAEALMRFRLYENGQITFGRFYGGIPNDGLQKTFREFRAGPAYDRFCALVTNLVTDGLIPKEVLDAPQGATGVGGSTAVSLSERPELPVGGRLSELLLRRARVMRTAGVGSGVSQPRGWPAPPRRDATGYIRRLPLGHRRRPAAEEDARRFFNDPHYVLPDGMNFVNPPIPREGADGRDVRVVARFRRESGTAGFMRDLRHGGGS